MSKQCERMRERTSEWPSALRVDFIVILSIVRRWWWRHGGSFSCQENPFSVNIVKALKRTINRNGMKSTFALSLATLDQSQNL